MASPMSMSKNSFGVVIIPYFFLQVTLNVSLVVPLTNNFSVSHILATRATNEQLLPLMYLHLFQGFWYFFIYRFLLSFTNNHKNLSKFWSSLVGFFLSLQYISPIKNLKYHMGTISNFEKCQISKIWSKIFYSQRKLHDNISNFDVGTVSAYGRAPLGFRTSAGTVVTNLGSHIYAGLALERSMHI